jgi:uncharacterized protein (DUF885 family)
MRRTTVLFAAALVAAAFACGSKKSNDDPAPAAEPGAAADDRAEQLAGIADRFYDEYLRRNPHRAADLGYHDYDGKLPDLSADALASEIAWLKKSRGELTGVGELDGIHEVERQVLLSEIGSQLFDLEVTREPQRNPMFYSWPAALIGYVSRDYAPIEQRADGLIAICEAVPAYFETAMTNLEEALPKTWIETALLQVRGAIEFAKSDVPKALDGLPEAKKKQVDAALATYVEALSGYASFLDKRLEKATDDYAIGAETFRQMLRDKEGVDLDLVKLREIGAADLQRNLTALAAAAKEIDPDKSIGEVVALVRADRPAPDEVLQVATSQSAEMRRFLVDNEVVSIPTSDVAEVRPSPPFMRWNFAFMSSPGPFEAKKLPSFYYISPPDPKWPAKMRREYIASRHDLLFVTIHEVWPGHFLHGLHIKKNPSKILRSFCSYAMSEGWAHYTEEMMWDAGAGGGDPKAHIGQLQNALLRNVRFMSAIGLHTGGMTVQESEKMFVDKGYQDAGSAKQQAVRGTFDPGYLNYTLGKLMIRKLHADWRAAQGDSYSLQAFHDQLLSYACAPVPVIRRAMLGAGAGPAL